MSVELMGKSGGKFWKMEIKIDVEGVMMMSLF